MSRQKLLLCALPLLVVATLATGVRAADEPTPSRLVTLKSPSIDVRQALQTLAREGGFNVIFHRDVRGIIPVQIKDVPALVACRAICAANDFAFLLQDERFRVYVVKPTPERAARQPPPHATPTARAGGPAMNRRYHWMGRQPRIMSVFDEEAANAPSRQ